MKVCFNVEAIDKKFISSTNNISRGSMVIRLLIVVAVSSLLASVTLATMQDSSNDVNDKAVLQNYLNGRANIESKLFEGGDYGDACGPKNFLPFQNAALTLGATMPGCAASVDNWAAEIKLPSQSGYYCLNLDGIATMLPASSNLNTGKGGFECDGV